ncbi:MAG: carboxypeptidase regulatory-like domain-containing protein [Planctomycetota bacterium]
MTRTDPLPPLLFAAALGLGTLAAQEVAPLVGRVVDPAGAPVAAAVVTIARGEGRGFRCLDLALRDRWRVIARLVTGADGRFGVQLPVGQYAQLVVDHPAFAVLRREDLVSGDLGAIALQAPCAFRGRLRRAADGSAATGGLRAWVDGVELFAGRTSAEGSFAFERLPACTFTLDLEPDALAAPMSFEVTLLPGGTVQRDVLLDDGRLLVGTVTDAATGAPIVGARIGEGWVQHKAVPTGADGGYRMAGFGGEGRDDLLCSAPGYVAAVAREVSAGAGPAGVGPVRVDFALERGAVLTGAVVDAEGRPIADAYVAALQGHPGAMHVYWEATRTDRDGRYRIDRLQPAVGGVLLVRSDGHAGALHHLRGIDAEYGLDLGPVALQPSRLVRGRLVDPAGQPIAGAEIVLQGTPDDIGRWGAPPPAWWLLEHYVGSRRFRTDAEGRFAFADVAAGAYAVALMTMGTPAAVVDVDVVADRDPDPVELIR